jgi:Leucine-rich repeat (LRR) protein
MWNRLAESSSRPRLTVTEYERERINQLGARSAEPGVFAALSNHADQVLGSLVDPDTREIAERVFRALATRGASGQMVRRSLSIRQLARESFRPSGTDGRAPTEAQLAELERQVITIADAFRADGHNFLTPPVEQVPQLTSDSMIDICHESLLRQWKTLNHWIEQESRSAATFIRLRDAALRWPDQEPLLRNPALGVALGWEEQQQPSAAWAERYGNELDRTLDFVRASEQGQRRETEVIEAMRRAELEHAQARAAEQAERAAEQARRAAFEAERAAEQEANARRFRYATIALTFVTAAAVVAAASALVERFRSVALNKSVEKMTGEKRRLETEITNLAGALNKSVEKMTGEKRRLETEITNLAAEKSAVEALTKKMNSDLTSLGEREKSLRLHNEALAAISTAHGFIKRLSPGEVAIDFLESSQSPDEALALLDRVGKVRSVSLSHTRISDAGLGKIKRLPDLKSLDLSFTDITDAGVHQISEMRQLTQLVINDTTITEKCLPDVEKLINLKSLDLSHNQVNKAAVDNLRTKLPGCTISYDPDPLLDGMSTYHGDWDKALISVGGHTFYGGRLSIGFSSVTDAALRFISNTRSESEVELSHCERITNSGLKYLGRARSIRSVNIASCSQISDLGVENLIGSAKFESLRFYDISLSDRALKVISAAPSLTSLEIAGTQHRISDEGLSHVPQLTALKKFELSFSNGLGKNAISYIAKLSKLESLTFQDNTNVPASAYAALAGLPLLRTLEIGYNDSLKDTDLKYLEGLKQVESLNLTSCNNLTEAGLEKLRKALPKAKVIWTPPQAGPPK